MTEESPREKMSIVIDQTSLRRSGRNVIGVIFWNFGSFRFPEDGWRDSSIPIIGWWMGACDKLLSGEKGREELRFMEGSFEVDIELVSDVAVELTCIDDRGPDKRSVFSTTARFKDLLDEFERAASAVEEGCARNGWTDVGGYRALAAKLKGRFVEAGSRLPPPQL